MAAMIIYNENNYRRTKKEVDDSLKNINTLFIGRVERNGSSYDIQIKLNRYVMRKSEYTYNIWLENDKAPVEGIANTFEGAYKLMLNDIRNEEEKMLREHNERAKEIWAEERRLINLAEDANIFNPNQ